MRRNSTIVLSIVFLLAAVSSVAGNLSAHPWLHDLFTPLATICILALAVSNWRACRKNYALWISIGLFFSLLGDIALLRAEEYFLPGLVAFLFTHIAYLTAFTRDTKFPARLSVWFLYLFVAAILYLFLFPRLPVALKLPVAVYAILLTSMAGQAMGRYFVVRSRVAQARCEWCAAVYAFRRVSRHRPVPCAVAARVVANSCSLLSGAVVDCIVHE